MTKDALVARYPRSPEALLHDLQRATPGNHLILASRSPRPTSESPHHCCWATAQARGTE